MKLLHIARGHVVVEVDNHTARIEGEGFLRPTGPEHPNHVDYVIYPSTLIAWDAPWEKLPLPDKTKGEILDFLRTEFVKRKIKLAVE